MRGGLNHKRETGKKHRSALPADTLPAASCNVQRRAQAPRATLLVSPGRALMVTNGYSLLCPSLRLLQIW